MIFRHGTTTLFARRLDQATSLEVLEAVNGAYLRPNTVYLAPGDQHLRLDKQGSNLIASLDRSDRVNGHRPSVDVLFSSIATTTPSKALAILCTGMGADGAQGLKNLRDAGGRCFAQDENSCVVYGMPREAAKLGAAEKLLPLSSMANTITQLAGQS